MCFLEWELQQIRSELGCFPLYKAIQPNTFIVMCKVRTQDFAAPLLSKQENELLLQSTFIPPVFDSDDDTEVSVDELIAEDMAFLHALFPDENISSSDDDTFSSDEYWFSSDEDIDVMVVDSSDE